MLVDAGAEVDASFGGEHQETPLHWAASSDDTEAAVALLDAGANIEAAGAVIGGGTPLDDAVAFGQWNAARLLVERGAHLRLWHAAALGDLDFVDKQITASAPPTPAEITEALWQACHGGQHSTAAYLADRGAEGIGRELLEHRPDHRRHDLPGAAACSICTGPGPVRSTPSAAEQSKRVLM